MGAIYDLSSDDPDRRYITILRGKLCSSTAEEFGLSVEIDARMRAELDDFYAACISKNGGIFVETHDNDIMACFGFPVPSESDVCKAVRAALAITEGARSLLAHDREYAGLDVRCGIHTGRVKLQGGTCPASRVLPEGGAVDVADCLADRADAGQVRVLVAPWATIARTSRSAIQSVCRLRVYQTRLMSSQWRT